MDFRKIKKFVQDRDYLFSEHADEERTKDRLTVVEIEEAILSGHVVEERLDDPRGESRLIAGKSVSGKLIHVVVGIRFERPIIVTNYLPDKDEWIGGIIRKR